MAGPGICAWRIPAHLRCTQCSILLHLMDICFLTCICLWQISHIQTRLFSVVGPGLVSTWSAWPACPKNGKSGPHCWGRKGSTQFAQQFLSAVTAPPLVGCVVWSQGCVSAGSLNIIFNYSHFPNNYHQLLIVLIQLIAP